jgi:hypothetical protein
MAGFVHRNHCFSQLQTINLALVGWGVQAVHFISTVSLPGASLRVPAAIYSRPCLSVMDFQMCRKLLRSSTAHEMGSRSTWQFSETWHPDLLQKPHSVNHFGSNDHRSDQF